MKFLSNISKSPLKFWGVVAGLPLLFVLVAAFMIIYQGSTRDIVAVADKFQPGPGWVMESEQIEPPRIICLGDVACPSVTRTWRLDEKLDEENFASLMKIYGSQGSPRLVDCSFRQINDGRICSVDTSVEGYIVQVYVKNVQDNASGQGHLIVFINKK